MTTQKLLQIPFVLLIVTSIVFAGCDSGINADGDTGTMEVLMHDAPANYDEVNVFVERVEVNNSESDEGWIELNSPQQSYDLLELTNGATEVLGSAELPVGTYEQVRLILSSENHSVVVDGKEHSMFVPSGEQTGIKLNVNAEIEPDFTYTMLLDFDAARSVVVRGNQQAGESYLLKPVIKATNEAVTGNIAGAVEPVDSDPFVYAIAGGDTLSSTKADTSNGKFKLIGLEEGSYTVSVDPTNDSYATENVDDVEVSVGETTELETITVPEN
ncbi:hypothetical protein CK503_15355 [Aliifodinibius salipaludis]|uniref:DUF4382 domain-containing protein n=1 Tax=Fodinibius salipaludis TaxID=2032627 RepID=A0A2A2G7A7_9BACT|nr:DUF4382 domain-containing protein [Aliifodinibius salipaludis]PAU92739.1 hypothetical protein CK503_15355 [Aliifodinibius salipaludis]